MAGELSHNPALAGPSSRITHPSTPSTLNPGIRSHFDIPSLSCSLLPQSHPVFSPFSGMLFPESALPGSLTGVSDLVRDTTPHPEPSHIPLAGWASCGFSESSHPTTALMALCFLCLVIALPVRSRLGALEVMAVYYQAPNTLISTEREQNRYFWFND